MEHDNSTASMELGTGMDRSGEGRAVQLDGAGLLATGVVTLARASPTSAALKSIVRETTDDLSKFLIQLISGELHFDVSTKDALHAYDDIRDACHTLRDAIDTWREMQSTEVPTRHERPEGPSQFERL